MELLCVHVCVCVRVVCRLRDYGPSLNMAVSGWKEQGVCPVCETRCLNTPNLARESQGSPAEVPSFRYIGIIQKKEVLILVKDALATEWMNLTARVRASR